MNQTKKKSEKNKFSKLRLRSASNLSKQLISPNPREKISSYFSLPINESENQTQPEKLFVSDSEIQYAQEVDSNVIKKTIDDENDFEKPTITKPAKSFEIKIQRHSKITKKRLNNKKGLSRFINDQVQPSISDTNQEHLQMALAMSKSLEEFENPQKNNEESASSFPSTQEKISNIKRTLDQFGFKSERSTVDIPTLKLNTRQQSRKKFKFFTPILFIKTDEDRAKLLETRVSQIISNISIYNKNIELKNSSSSNEEYIDNKPRSFLLRDYYDEDSTIFKKNYLNITEMNDSTFYNTIISPEIVKTGALLRDWGSIPGREKTPPLIERIVTEEIQSTPKNNQKQDDNSVSPDLFAEYDLETNENKISESPNLDNFILTDKDRLSEDSETNSVSLLDNISPRRGKYKSPVKKQFSEFSSTKRKSLFNDNELNSVSLLDNNFGLTLLHEKNTDRSQIDHYESFCDNSNDVFDLTKSSDDSNDLFEEDTEIKSLNNEKNITENELKNTENLENVIEKQNTVQSDIFSVETQILKIISPEKNQYIDLTQSSNEFNTVILNKNYLSQEIAINGLCLKETKITPKSNKDDKINSCLEEINDESLSSNLGKVPRNKLKKSLMRSFSENIIGDKEFQYTSKITDKSDFFKLSSPLNIKSFRASFGEINDEKSFVCYNSTLQNKNIASKINLSQSFENIVVSDEELNYSVNKFCEFEKSKTENKNINGNTDNCGKFNISIEDLNFLSQSSIETSSDISDDELNYSCNASLRRKKFDKKIDEIINQNENLKCNSKDLETGTNFIDFNDLPYNGFEPTRTSLDFNTTEVLKHPRVKDLSTPLKNKSYLLSDDSLDEIIKQKEFTPIAERVNTPESAKNVECITPNSDVIIKTTNVTPIPDYSDMESPERDKELEKFGLKPMKRAKGIKILRYIYEATHPISGKTSEKTYENSSDDEDNKIIKRRKKNAENIIKERSNPNTNEPRECLGNKIAESENIEDMIFERKQSSKIYSCRIPLHIVWHNLVTNQTDLLEKILLYEPLQVEEIYSQLKSFGFKFHIQDLITFLDKKCITIRINQNNRKSKKTGS